MSKVGNSLAFLIGTFVVGAILSLNHAEAEAQTPVWYYCEPAHAYYPYVSTCPVPWRTVTSNPNTNSQAGSQQQGTATPANPAVTAPPGYIYDTGSFVPHAKDPCVRPETIQSIIDFLNAKVGKPDGPLARIISASGFTTIQNESIHGPTLTCHGILETTEGRSDPGAVKLLLTDDSRGDVFTAKDATWESDSDRDRKKATFLTRQAAAMQAQNRTNFHGDIASWTGIPPLPLSASPSQSPEASVHCTVADAAGHMVSIWATKQDCTDWINKDQVLGKSGPTPMQIYNYRLEQCAQRIGERGTIQAYSGEFMEACTRIVPMP